MGLFCVCEEGRRREGEREGGRERGRGEREREGGRERGREDGGRGGEGEWIDSVQKPLTKQSAQPTIHTC